jgi:ribosomal protein L11 methylase PrmA
MTGGDEGQQQREAQLQDEAQQREAQQLEEEHQREAPRVLAIGAGCGAGTATAAATANKAEAGGCDGDPLAELAAGPSCCTAYNAAVQRASGCEGPVRKQAAAAAVAGALVEASTRKQAAVAADAGVLDGPSPFGPTLPPQPMRGARPRWRA